MLIVASKVRDRIRATGHHTGGDALDGLNAAVAWLIDQATLRARANRRRTLRGHDFIIAPPARRVPERT